MSWWLLLIPVVVGVAFWAGYEIGRVHRTRVEHEWNRILSRQLEMHDSAWPTRNPSPKGDENKI